MLKPFSIFIAPAILFMIAGSVLADAVPVPHVIVAAERFLATGPVSISPGQVATVCAARIDEGQGAAPLNVVVAVIDASNSRLLAVREAALQPGASLCIVTPGPPQTGVGGPNQTGPNGASLVLGIVVRNGSIRQGHGNLLIEGVGPGGGCIVGSLQLQPFTGNGIGPATLYVSMEERRSIVQGRFE